MIQTKLRGKRWTEIVLVAVRELALTTGGNEVLFLVAGYNRGGYALYYDEFRKRAVFTWEYH